MLQKLFRGRVVKAPTKLEELIEQRQHLEMLRLHRQQLKEQEELWLREVNDLFKTNYVTMAAAEGELEAQIEFARDYA